MKLPGGLSMPYSLQDATAALVSVVIILGVVVLAVLERPIPPELGPPLGGAVTWLFIRSAQTTGKVNGT